MNKNRSRIAILASCVTLATSLILGVPALAADDAPLVPLVSSSTSGVVRKPTNLKVGQVFATLYVPRYGKKYQRKIAEGTSLSKVLNGVGLGHYSVTQMPGEVGNFAIAGHRFGNGGPMLLIDKLKAGDRAYVKTKTTWYTYEWLQTKIVKPSAINSIAPIPAGLTKTIESGKYLTFTSCTPVHVNTFRIIAWFGYVSEQPVSQGMPAELAALLGK